ncbi:PREDICTED: uncharacterized protein LOC109584801 [Amphimedon queenslandica]|uniref:Uncharacterized protein n=1 Tax=Amphimedon queenslandica TaxID=400682 RepID=A0A1X7U409_AMPQE|nr:PREDICTED: uncharacterized protein LOC109584801 [Amphimedon queenslandica]|eukprot:XP_019856236.1 PREDICTED: uncharacterized protein LOC109584801 [Amphimedon queenslandica]
MKVYFAIVAIFLVLIAAGANAQDPKQSDVFEQELNREDNPGGDGLEKEAMEEPDGSQHLSSDKPHPVNIANAHAQGRRYYTCHYCICSKPRGSHGMSYTSSCYRCYGRSRKWQRCYYCSCSAQYNNYYSYFGFCYSCY